MVGSGGTTLTARELRLMLLVALILLMFQLVITLWMLVSGAWRVSHIHRTGVQMFYNGVHTG